MDDTALAPSNEPITGYTWDGYPVSMPLTLSIEVGKGNEMLGIGWGCNYNAEKKRRPFVVLELGFCAIGIGWFFG
jgi:hypothetical protein